MTLQNAINEVRKALPSEMRIHPSVASAVRTLLEHAEKTEPDKLTDALTNMIDENIRRQRCGTYDEWQAEVVRVLRG